MRDLRASSAAVWLIAGILLGLLFSKYSALAYYNMGYTKGSTEFKVARDTTCKRWWFDDSASRLKDAKTWMCGRK
jgi:hypothetical protein